MKLQVKMVQTTCFVFNERHIDKYRPSFFRLVDGQEEQKKTTLLNKESRFDKSLQADFKIIPGSPLSYWISDNFRSIFGIGDSLEDIATPRQGLSTTDNGLFHKSSGLK